MSSTKQRKKHQCNKSLSKEMKSIRKKSDIDDKSDSGNGDSEDPTSFSCLSAVEKMTSKDFQDDTNAHVEIIYEMLKDSVRIEKYKAAILHNKHLFRGKCVLDIGCGVGIFSLFAAKAGAAKVYAVDTSNVVCYARKVVEVNGYENVIEVLKGKIEDIELPVKEVDIIISDWVGYALLYRSICDAVIYARDKWLKKEGGLIFPDQAKLFMVALEDGKHKNDNIEWWNRVYGFNMNCLRGVALKEPRYQKIKPQQVLSKQCAIKCIDLYTATKEDLQFRSKYILPMKKTGHMDGIALYFHVYFTKSHTPLGFSTDPWSAGTNWMQTIFFLDQSLSVQEKTIYYGGIEMFSPLSPPDLNDMTVNLELLMGDPSQPDVDVEMNWKLKQPTAELDPPCSVANIGHCAKGDEKTGNANSETFHIPKMDGIIPSKCSVPGNHDISTTTSDFPCDTPPPIVVQSTRGSVNDITLTLGVQTNDFACDTPPPIVEPTRGSGNVTLTIGGHNYPCRKNRRYKTKHSKKG